MSIGAPAILKNRTPADRSAAHGPRNRITHWARRSVGAVLALVGAIAMSGCAISLQSLPKVSGIDASTYPIYAVFSNVLNLPDEAQVRLGAQVVGQVGAISTRNFQADLTLDIKKSVRLPVGTIAQVRFDDPLGDEYILLQEPSVPPATTTDDTSRFLGSPSPHTGQLDQHRPQRRGHLRGPLPRPQRWRDQPAPNHHPRAEQHVQRKPNADPLVPDHHRRRRELPLWRESRHRRRPGVHLEPEHANSTGAAPTIANGISTIAPAIGVLASENQQISGLLTQLSKLGAVGTQIAQQSGQNAVDDAKDLLPVVQQLDSVSAQLTPDLKRPSRLRGRDPQDRPGRLPAGERHRQRAPARRGVRADARWTPRWPTRGHRHLRDPNRWRGARRCPSSWPRACGDRGPMNQNLLPRMIALAVVIVIGVYYIVFDIMQYHITSQPFPVTVLMPSAGGLYTGADVTYRGVQVGTVTALDLDPGDVAVKLAIQAGEHIPDNGPVRVKELSALGEQYLDLQPATGSGPDLRSGTVIPANRVSLPTPIGTALVDLNSLLQSVNPQDLVTDENFLASAFVGTGPDLRTIIVTGQRLSNALIAAQPETVNLVVDGQTDLQTLEATDSDLASFSQGLASLTAQLRDSNSDVRALIRNSQSAEQQLNPFLAAKNAQITSLVSNLATDSQVTAEHDQDVQAVFQLLPFVSNDLASVVGGGQVHGELDFNTADPVCPYIPGNQMPGPTQAVASPALDNTCTTVAPGMFERGANSGASFPGG